MVRFLFLFRKVKGQKTKRGGRGRTKGARENKFFCLSSFPLAAFLFSIRLTLV